jgi:hypothetical protein
MSTINTGGTGGTTPPPLPPFNLIKGEVDETKGRLNISQRKVVGTTTELATKSLDIRRPAAGFGAKIENLKDKLLGQRYVKVRVATGKGMKNVEVSISSLAKKMGLSRTEILQASLQAKGSASVEELMRDAEKLKYARSIAEGQFVKSEAKNLKIKTMEKVIFQALKAPINAHGQTLIEVESDTPNKDKVDYLMQRDLKTHSIVKLANVTERTYLGQGTFGTVDQIGNDLISGESSVMKRANTVFTSAVESHVGMEKTRAAKKGVNLEEHLGKTEEDYRTTIHEHYTLLAQKDILNSFHMLKDIHAGVSPLDQQFYDREAITPGIEKMRARFFGPGMREKRGGMQPPTHLFDYKGQMVEVSPKAEFGDLHDFLNDHTKNSIPVDFEQSFINMALWILEWTYLGAINADIKPENMLVWQSGDHAEITLADVGGARWLNEMNSRGTYSSNFASKNDLERIDKAQHNSPEMQELQTKRMVLAFGKSMTDQLTRTKTEISSHVDGAKKYNLYMKLLMDMTKENADERCSIVQVIEDLETIKFLYPGVHCFSDSRL